jgi:hypothetical protein
MYVANSEPAYGEVVRLTQGSPPVLVPIIAKGAIKPNRIGEPEAGQGTEGGRFTGCTDDSGPMKPGNSVEDKTLTIRKLGVL